MLIFWFESYSDELPEAGLSQNQFLKILVPFTRNMQTEPVHWVTSDPHPANMDAVDGNRLN